MFDASLSNGVRYLIAARCNAIWSTSRAVAARLLRNGHPFVGRQCPICRTPLGAFSPVGHLITACTDPRIQAYRDTIGFSREFFVLLWQHAHEVAGLLPAPDVNSLDLSILVLGGTLCGGATLGNDWLAGFSQMGTVVAPPAGRVVHFLQRTMWSYSSSLWAYHRNAAASYRDHQFAATAGFFRSPMFDASLSNGVRQQRRNCHDVGRPDLPVSSRDGLRKFVLARTLATSSRNDSTDRYAATGFIHTAGFVHDPMFDQPRSRGVRLVAALRMNGLWTARSAQHIAGRLVNHPFAADRCILCNHGIDNVHPLAHLVIVCVSAGLNPLIDSAKEQDPQANDDTILTRLLGGASQGEAAPRQTWLGGTVEYTQQGTEGRPPAARLADFLSVAYPRYQVRLWHFHKE
ncbi:hypothetical protein HK105_206294 [Polyrhizophydium stewartii]|uniref:Uncharacterized protein n=1 Tax=Polyrhizophydium stewartii TaxID=2732419 RepID=A0ABR4N3W3_9FUNG